MSDTTGTWRTSSYGQPNGGNRVEVADSAEAVGVRDSKNPGGGGLNVTPGQ